jgi:uncharacterized protein (DUF1697 family)
MRTWIALLRGVGGGIRPLPMRPLAAALQARGFSDVRTYIQSGNVVFRHASRSAPALARLISACIADDFDMDVNVLVLSVEELERAMAGNPFPEAEAAPTTVHVFFLAGAPPGSRLDALQAIKAPTEQFVLNRRVLYVHTPQGFGISKLGKQAQRLLGVDATARNWRTVSRILALAKAVGPGLRLHRRLAP